MQQQKVLSFDK